MLTNYDYIVDRESKFGTIHFDYIDDNRLVDYKNTASIVFRIEVWFDKNSDSFGRGFLIPENSKHAVEHYESLLEDDVTLAFNEALFLLLGLNVLSLALSQFSNMDLINYKKSLDSSNTIEEIFFTTAECSELIRSELINSRIRSKNLIELGERHGFFSEFNNENNLRKVSQSLLLNKPNKNKLSKESVNKSTTIALQKLITEKAKEIMKKNKGIKKHHVADDISKWLLKEHKKSLTSGSIQRDYLQNYQELKQIP